MSTAYRASMRPRHKAAENLRAAVALVLQGIASMRPRHKAAENAAARPSSRGTAGGFNEAAA